MSQFSLTSLQVIIKTHEDSMKKTKAVMEKRGKSHLKRVNKVFQKIALDDIDYVRDKLATNLKDKDAPVVPFDPFDE